MSPSDVYEQLKANRNPNWVEDWDFLVRQRKVPQVSIMGRLDSVSVQREKKREMRTQNTPLRAKRTRINEEIPSETLELLSESDDTSISTDEEFRDEYRPRSKTPRPSCLFCWKYQQRICLKKQDKLLIVGDYCYYCDEMKRSFANTSIFNHSRRGKSLPLFAIAKHSPSPTKQK
jgi:hypothetical protein